MSNESKPIEAGEQAFTTTDAELANALITAGCRYAPADSGGPAQMHFTPDRLRGMWVTNRLPDGQRIRRTMLPQGGSSAVDFELAAMRAVKLKNPGIVTHFIVRDTVFREAIAAHDAIVCVFTDADRTGNPPALPNLQTMTEAAMIMTVLFIARKNRDTVDAMGWLRSPMLALTSVKRDIKPIKGASQATLEEMSYKAEGNGKIWSMDLSDDDRAHMEIHPKPRP